MILIQNCYIVEKGINNVIIHNNKIHSITKEIDPKFMQDIDIIIDAKNKVLVPAFFDIHCHLREPGQTYKEDLDSGLTASAKGGYSDVLCMANTDPVIDNMELAMFLEGIAKKNKAASNLHVAYSLTKEMKGNRLNGMDNTTLGYNFYTDDGLTNESPDVLKRALQRTIKYDSIVAVHAEDAEIRNNGIINDGDVSEKLGLRGNPRQAEIFRIARDIDLVEKWGGRLHIQHITTKEGLQMVVDAKKRGLNITCEVTPHHLTLTDNDILTADNKALFKVAPPLRTSFDVDYLINNIDYIDCIASDHAPHSYEEKQQDIVDAPFGIPNIEVLFALLYTKLVLTNRLEFKKLIHLLTDGPRRVINRPLIHIDEGSVANLALIDLDKEIEVNESIFLSKAKYSPWTGLKLKGWNVMTIINGNIVYMDDDVGSQLCI